MLGAIALINLIKLSAFNSALLIFIIILTPSPQCPMPFPVSGSRFLANPQPNVMKNLYYPHRSTCN